MRHLLNIPNHRRTQSKSWLGEVQRAESKKVDGIEGDKEVPFNSECTLFYLASYVKETCEDAQHPKKGSSKWTFLELPTVRPLHQDLSGGNSFRFPPGILCKISKKAPFRTENAKTAESANQQVLYPKTSLVVLRFKTLQLLGHVCDGPLLPESPKIAQPGKEHFFFRSLVFTSSFSKSEGQNMENIFNFPEFTNQLMLNLWYPTSTIHQAFSKLHLAAENLERVYHYVI